MSRFLQGNVVDSFSWIEYDNSSSKQESNISKGKSPEEQIGLRKSKIFTRLVNISYYSLLIGGSLYAIVHYLDNERRYRLPFLRNLAFSS
jgi:hypothetical protein